MEAEELLEEAARWPHDELWPDGKLIHGLAAKLRHTLDLLDKVVHGPPAEMSYRGRLLPVNSTGMREVVDEAVAALGILSEIVGDDACVYDHHGYCQTHKLDEAPCPYTRARDLLA
jgi:hypothetical protein